MSYLIKKCFSSICQSIQYCYVCTSQNLLLIQENNISEKPVQGAQTLNLGTHLPCLQQTVSMKNVQVRFFDIIIYTLRKSVIKSYENPIVKIIKNYLVKKRFVENSKLEINLQLINGSRNAFTTLRWRWIGNMGTYLCYNLKMKALRV